MNMSNVLYLGAGESIGTEKFLRKDIPQSHGDQIIKSVQSGYMSPLKDKKMIKQDKERISEARMNDSTFIEVVKVELTGEGEETLSSQFEEVIKFFFSCHDPTLAYKNLELAGHWADSYIFCDDEAQAAIAEKFRKELQNSITNKFCTVYKNDSIVTKIGKTRPFFKACLAQQDYMTKRAFHKLPKNQKIYFETWPTEENPTKFHPVEDVKDNVKKVAGIIASPFRKHDEQQTQ